MKKAAIKIIIIKDGNITAIKADMAPKIPAILYPQKMDVLMAIAPGRL